MDNIIRVYTEDMELLAVFSNNNAVYSDENKKDILVAPTIRNVLNSESTLSFTILKDSRKWQSVKDPRNIWICNGRVYTALNDNSFVYNGEIVTVTLVEIWYLLAKQYVQVHNVDTDVEAMDEHTVKILPKTDEEFKMTVNGVEYDDDEIVDSRGVLLPRGSAGYALWGLIKGNNFGWTIGICDVIEDDFSAEDDFGTFNLETDMQTLLDNILCVQSLWGGVFVWDSLNKIIHLRDETKDDSDFNEWKGFTVRKGKNMAAEPVITVDNNIITKAYILGNSSLNIKAVNDDLTYIENYSYTDKVYEGYLTNANIYYTGASSTSGQEQLLYWGEKELEKMCKPRISAEINIIDRRNEDGYTHEIFDIGDIVKVYYTSPLTDESEETIEYQRITAWEYNVWLPSESTITVGDKILNQREIYKLVYDNSVDGSSLTDWTNGIDGSNVYINIDESLSGYYGEGTRYSLVDITQGNVDVVTGFIQETDDNFTETYAYINQVSTDLGSQITLLTSYTQQSVTALENSIIDTNASISLLSTELGSEIALKASYTYVNSEISTNQTTIMSNVAAIYITADDVDSKIQAVSLSSVSEGTMTVTSTNVSMGVDATNSFYQGKVGVNSNGIYLTSIWGNILLSSENRITIEGYYDLGCYGNFALYLATNNNIYLNAQKQVTLGIGDGKPFSAEITGNRIEITENEINLIGNVSLNGESFDSTVAVFG